MSDTHSTSDTDNYYIVLGITTDATTDDVRKAYRKEALKWHPDKPNGDATRFKRINEAYQVLADDSTRLQYDSILNSTSSDNQYHYPNMNNNFHHHHHQQHRHQHHHHSAFPDVFSGGDPFAHFNFAFRAADEVFRSVFGADFSSINSGFNSRPTDIYHSTDPFHSAFHHHAHMIGGMSNPFSAHLAPMQAMFSPSMSSMSSMSSSSSSSSSRGNFISTSSSRSVDAHGNVIEESITVDHTGKRTVKRVINGVQQPISSSISNSNTHNLLTNNNYSPSITTITSTNLPHSSTSTTTTSTNHNYPTGYYNHRF